MLNRQIWRLFTAPLVHFTPSHLAYDTFALIVAGSLIESRRYRGLAGVCVLTPLASGLTVSCFEPELVFYGGLSGVATAAVVLLALGGLREDGFWRWASTAALVAVVGKLWFEFTARTFDVLPVNPASFRPVPLCHLAGLLTGTAVFVWKQWQVTQRYDAVRLVIN